MSETQTGMLLTWPPERFYWAVLDAPGIRAGVLPSGLEHALQDELPVPVDAVHAVGAPLKEGRLLVCACAREELGALSPDTLSLRATSLPDDLDLGPETPAPPEVLVGLMEPKPLRRERTRRSVLLAASILLASSLMTVGLLRRGQALSEEANAASAASAAALKQTSSGNNLLSLQRDVQLLRASKSPSQALTAPDASQALASLLAGWPTHVECEATNVSVTPTALSLSLSVNGDARQLLAALKAPEGWRAEEPRLNTSGARTRVSLTYKRAGEKK